MSSIGIVQQGIRFLLAGGLNTLLSLVVYQIALLFFRHELAYAICWLAGLAFLVLFYPGKVFGVPHSSFRTKALVVLLYIVSFVSGLFLLESLVAYQVMPELAIFAVLVFTSTFNFFSMRYLLRPKS